MKTLVFAFFFCLVSAQETRSPFEIDLITNFINNDSKVSVQVQNNSLRTLSFLEGFVNIRTVNGKLVKELRITIVKNNEPALGNGQVRTESVRFHNRNNEFFLIDFQVSKLKFSEDHRYYTWHPSVGFIRID